MEGEGGFGCCNDNNCSQVGYACIQQKKKKSKGVKKEEGSNTHTRKQKMKVAAAKKGQGREMPKDHSTRILSSFEGGSWQWHTRLPV